MKNYGRFGPLLGVIHLSNRHCKFLVYAAQNAEILTCHEIKLAQVQGGWPNVDGNEPGWVEYNPMDIWKSVVECIECSTKNLLILDINPNDLVGLGITNQRATTILWNKSTGLPLYNAIAYDDVRTCATVDSILERIKNKKNLLKEVCGLPISSHFSSMKVRWLVENCPEIRLEFKRGTCLFGTLDTWIIWNITGGIRGGVHVTDVTNASHTMLMNLRSLQWDRNLCDFFEIPIEILPTIKSCSEVYGYVDGGPLNGLPVAGCIGDQQAALLGQMAFKPGEVICTYDDGCSVLFNTGQEIIDSENGLLSTVGFQLGLNEKVYYALEGTIASAGSCISWLKDNLQMGTDLNANFLNLVSDIIFVPAFCGLCSPFWNHNARSTLMGLTTKTSSHEITVSAYEAICFQTREILEVILKDCRNWPTIVRLIVGGESSEDFTLLQMISNLCGVEIERPQISHPSCLGAMIAAGLTTRVLSLENNKVMSCFRYTPPTDNFFPVISSNEADIRYEKWKRAINKFLRLDDRELRELEFDKSGTISVLDSIPGGLFFFSTFVLLTVAHLLKN